MKLIAIDLDGTLLSPKMEITKENLAAIREAQNQGNIVMICSGRAPEDIQQILKKYDLSIPLAGSNGSVVQAQDRVLQSVSMNREDISKVAEKLDKERFPYRIYTSHGIYVPADWSERIALVCNRNRSKSKDFQMKFIKKLRNSRKNPVSLTFLITIVNCLV